MTEPVTAIGLSAIAAYVGKDGIQKLLGPTADYLGNGLRDFTERRVETIGRIFQKAETKLGDKINFPGEVPPKVLKAVLSEGSFSTEPLAVEYLGGILASSRTELGRDDRGARIAKTIDALSSYQLRTHYLIYATLRTLFSKSGISVNMDGRPKMRMFLPFSGYLPAMDFSEREIAQGAQLLSHIFFGLHGDGLLEDAWQYGDEESLKKAYPGVKGGGIVCQPSALGVELFLWGFGHSDKPLDYIFSDEFSHSIDDLPESINGACATIPPDA